MKIKLNKNHLNNKAGDEIEVTPEQAEYFKRIGMVDEGEESEPVKRGRKPNKEN